MICDQSYAIGIPHIAIKWECNIDNLAEADHAQVTEWNPPTMRTEYEEAAEKLNKVVQREWTHLGKQCKEDKVEQKAIRCQKELRNVIHLQGNEIRLYCRLKT